MDEDQQERDLIPKGASSLFESHARRVFGVRFNYLSSEAKGLLRALWQQGIAVGAGGCEHCSDLDGVEFEDARTSYCWDGEGEDPNRPLVLCRSCAAEHHANWDEQWREYYSGLL